MDAMGTDRITGEVVLTISDHLHWDEEHLVQLEKKLAAYVRFCESGQIVETNPDAATSKVAISIIAQHRPTDEAVQFLEEAAKAIAKRGLILRYGPIPTTGYVHDAG